MTESGRQQCGDDVWWFFTVQMTAQTESSCEGLQFLLQEEPLATWCITYVDSSNDQFFCQRWDHWIPADSYLSSGKFLWWAKAAFAGDYVFCCRVWSCWQICDKTKDWLWPVCGILTCCPRRVGISSWQKFQLNLAPSWTCPTTGTKKE